jgi:glycosyltransferase involved in cell wall biosynthesis
VGLDGAVIYNPVPDSAFAGQRTDPQGDLVVAAGRLVREKGFDLLIRAMSNVDARLAIAGDGPLRDGLATLISELGLQHRVRLVGRLELSALQGLYGDAVLTCVPSLWAEPFGYAVAEAMAAGVPVVATPVGAFPELLGDGRGVVAPDLTPGGLATSIRGALEDRGERDRRAQAARSFAFTQLHVDVIGPMYMERYAT